MPKTEKTIWIIIFSVLIIGGTLLYFINNQPVKEQPNVPLPLACTEEAKICPDGSAVGRTLPNCEFAPCPVVATTTDDRLTFVSEDKEFSFLYPNEIGTTYISTEAWPPIVTSSATTTLICDNAGDSASSGQKQLRLINNREYCITIMSEGAAGSTYTTYNYETIVSNKLFTTTFTLRLIQCLNYDQPKQEECLAEREKFNPDELVTPLVESIK
jgi:hypothetical protein